jgi:hypothetical protein
MTSATIAVMVLLLAGGAGGFIVGYIWGVERERRIGKRSVRDS